MEFFFNVNSECRINMLDLFYQNVFTIFFFYLHFILSIHSFRSLFCSYGENDLQPFRKLCMFWWHRWFVRLDFFPLFHNISFNATLQKKRTGTKCQPLRFFRSHSLASMLLCRLSCECRAFFLSVLKCLEWIFG